MLYLLNNCIEYFYRYTLCVIPLRCNLYTATSKNIWYEYSLKKIQIFILTVEGVVYNYITLNEQCKGHTF